MSWFVECLEVLSCRNFYKYVLNDCHFHSKCGENCCDCEVETDEVKDSPPHPSHTKIDIHGVVHYESDAYASEHNDEKLSLIYIIIYGS